MEKLARIKAPIDSEDDSDVASSDNEGIKPKKKVRLLPY